MSTTNRPARAPAHLAPESLEQLRTLLLAEVGEHDDVVTHSTEAAAGLTGEQGAESILERELAEAAARRAELALEEVHHALAKLDDGTFGSCERCDDPLPFERLEAIPHTRFCVRCAAIAG